MSCRLLTGDPLARSLDLAHLGKQRRSKLWLPFPFPSLSVFLDSVFVLRKKKTWYLFWGGLKTDLRCLQGEMGCRTLSCHLPPSPPHLLNGIRKEVTRSVSKSNFSLWHFPLWIYWLRWGTLSAFICMC